MRSMIIVIFMNHIKVKMNTVMSIIILMRMENIIAMMKLIVINIKKNTIIRKRK